MLLAIDVGNTNTTVGAFEGSTLRHHWRLQTDQNRTADEYGILIRQLFELSGTDVSKVSAVAIANVVPPRVSVNLDRLATLRDPWQLPDDVIVVERNAIDKLLARSR